MTKLEKLLRCSMRLAEQNFPECVWCESSDRPSGHWSDTLDAMQAHDLRRLTEYELTCLSLSRAYGPVPVLTDSEASALVAALWPQGNATGQWLSWESLSDRLWHMACDEGTDACVLRHCV